MMPNGNLVLTSVTVALSGDYFYCEIGWNDHMITYNATYQIFIDNCETKQSIFTGIVFLLPCNSTAAINNPTKKPSQKLGT